MLPTSVKEFIGHERVGMEWSESSILKYDGRRVNPNSIFFREIPNISLIWVFNHNKWLFFFNFLHHALVGL